MDGLFTVFGLGTAFGVFCSWIYDVIRKRNQPVNRGASFEAFHGSEILPAPEPVASARVAEPSMDREVGPAFEAPKPPSAPPAVSGYVPEVKMASKAPDILDAERSEPFQPLAPIVAASPATPSFASTSANVAFEPAFSNGPEHGFSASDVPADTLIAADASDDNKATDTPTPRQEAEFMVAEPVAEKSEPVEVFSAPEVTFEAAPDKATEPDFNFAVERVDFDVQQVDFSDTVPFEATNLELPRPSAPRVVLLVNDTLVREVQENDMADLMREFGIMAGSEQAQLFQAGDVVTIGRTSVQLTQV